ncbi:8-amino-7-oxononanoate synthase [Fundidesulfovibrio magnetotacticus]|uniref:8-amino-7-oxononanoate synthase n=1 Tax=Fundidesulfovibrio magnetotacticus TaxID=2730080 RepID=A0A6V8LPM7_9BACT|nr:8-amino-7-oxononanoate synthase [Fundidesulfovibrio magnetotacticus]GFK92491.1 8-amino-7-oxononanoate synthase [Fundidesulfovibrio magnetotacticus]
MPEERYRQALAESRNAGRLRATRAFDPGRREILDASSNDYLGLSRHPAVVERACAFARRWGAGSASARLIRGTLPPHDALEEKLARLKGHEAALLMGSGYQTNASAIAALLDERTLSAEPLVFADKLNHASMHEGCRLAGARQLRYRHLDLDHLEALLGKHAHEKRARFILSESVFSMDGDRADVHALADLAARHGAFLYLDEAHATGVFGPTGMGLAEGVAMESGLVMGTLGKSLGSYGAYVCCSRAVREYLVNRASGFIFSTALPPPCLGAADAALDLVPTLAPRRERLLALAEALRGRLNAAGLSTERSSTQIVPVILGHAARALAAMEALRRENVLAVAVRPPTVPEGSSRLRLSLTALHTPDDVERLADAVVRAAGACS